jgi:GlpG protein
LKVIGSVYYHFRLAFMRVIETSIDEDLSLFSGYLWQQRVAHRVYEERGGQVLEVADPKQAEVVRGAYRAWRAGSLTLQAVPRPPRPRRAGAALLRYPGLTLLIGLAVVAFPFTLPLAEDRVTGVAAWLSLVDPRQLAATLPTLGDVLGSGEVWRWFTPIFLHFSVVHLAFNCAVTIELGRRVEAGATALGLWLVVLLVAAASNLAQYAFGGGPVFGGLSGVAFGLLGFILVLNRRFPQAPIWALPKGLAGGLLVFLVLFSTGITEAFNLYVANVAHWVGLEAGALLGLVWRPPAGRTSGDG